MQRYISRFKRLTEMGMGLNKDFQARDKILFGGPVNWERQDSSDFSGITLEQVEELIEKGFADPDEKVGEAPCIYELKDLMAEHDGKITVKGMAISPNNPNYCVVFDGFDGKGLDEKSVVELVKKYRLADQLEFEPKKGTISVQWVA